MKKRTKKNTRKKGRAPNFRLGIRAPCHSFGVTSFPVKTPKKGREPQLPVAHARTRGTPSGSRFRSYNFRSGPLPVTSIPIRAASADVTSGSYTAMLHHCKGGFVTTYILLTCLLTLRAVCHDSSQLLLDTDNKRKLTYAITYYVL